MVLFVSTRRGRSLGELVKREIWARRQGVIALVACFYDGDHSGRHGDDRGESADPIARGERTLSRSLFRSDFVIYLRYLRPGASASVGHWAGISYFLYYFGGWVAKQKPSTGAVLYLLACSLHGCWWGYGFVAAVLPVWLLLAPRDYLSTFLKLVRLSVWRSGILIMRPTLTMPALTKFVDGTGPVWTGDLFPVPVITIACGAVSSFHALILGTTPKMLANEGGPAFIGYGGMLMESFVAIMALVSLLSIRAFTFAMNSPMAVL